MIMIVVLTIRISIIIIIAQLTTSIIILEKQ